MKAPVGILHRTTWLDKQAREHNEIYLFLFSFYFVNGLLPWGLQTISSFAFAILSDAAVVTLHPLVLAHWPLITKMTCITPLHSEIKTCTYLYNVQSMPPDRHSALVPNALWCCFVIPPYTRSSGIKTASFHHQVWVSIYLILAGATEFSCHSLPGEICHVIQPFHERQHPGAFWNCTSQILSYVQSIPLSFVLKPIWPFPRLTQVQALTPSCKHHDWLYSQPN